MGSVLLFGRFLMVSFVLVLRELTVTVGWVGGGCYLTEPHLILVPLEKSTVSPLLGDWTVTAVRY